MTDRGGAPDLAALPLPPRLLPCHGERHRCLGGHHRSMPAVETKSRADL